MKVFYWLFSNQKVVIMKICSALLMWVDTRKVQEVYLKKVRQQPTTAESPGCVELGSWNSNGVGGTQAK